MQISLGNFQDSYLKEHLHFRNTFVAVSVTFLCLLRFTFLSDQDSYLVSRSKYMFLTYNLLQVHKDCRINFRTRINRYNRRSKENILETSDVQSQEREVNQIPVLITISKIEVTDNAKHCFIYKENE